MERMSLAACGEAEDAEFLPTKEGLQVAILERDVIQQGVDENGNPTIDFPLARLGWIEDTAEIKAAPGPNDYIPIVDVDNQGQMKKTPAAALGGGAAQYNTAASYAVGDYCTKDGKLYRCTSAWDASCWAETSIAEELKGAVQTATGGTEQQYSETTPYAAGDYCTKDGKLYRCMSAVTAGSAWDAASWRETSAAQEFQALQAAVGKTVPASQTVNGKALSADIALSAGDVGAVPTSRTVNGKALSANITLSASDVGAMPAGGDSGAVPAGLIAIWSGSASAIPNGWALCNGQNGTPDLRNRFVLGAGSSYSVGATGGEKTHTLTESEMPKHTHNGRANDVVSGSIGGFYSRR